MKKIIIRSLISLVVQILFCVFFIYNLQYLWVLERISYIFFPFMILGSVGLIIALEKNIFKPETGIERYSSNYYLFFVLVEDIVSLTFFMYLGLKVIFTLAVVSYLLNLLYAYKIRNDKIEEIK